MPRWEQPAAYRQYCPERALPEHGRLSPEEQVEAIQRDIARYRKHLRERATRGRGSCCDCSPRIDRLEQMIFQLLDTVESLRERGPVPAKTAQERTRILGAG